MPTTVAQDREFLSAIISESRLLEDAINWIADNMKPAEVFSDKQLTSWAVSKGYEKVD